MKPYMSIYCKYSKRQAPVISNITDDSYGKWANSYIIEKFRAINSVHHNIRSKICLYRKSNFSTWKKVDIIFVHFRKFLDTIHHNNSILLFILTPYID